MSLRRNMGQQQIITLHGKPSDFYERWKFCHLKRQEKTNILEKKIKKKKKQKNKHSNNETS